MSLVIALAIGVGLGLACFGGLWLSLRQWMRTPRRTGWLALGQLSRLALCGLVFWALSRQGAGAVLAALAGLWVARWQLIYRLGVARHGR